MTMEAKEFIKNYKEAFGESAELPLVFWYSDKPEGVVERINGCFFKGLRKVRDGVAISLNAETIGCGGGQFYTGFIDMPDRIPNFVSLKEHYKQTPEMVKEFIDELGVNRTESLYLHFARFDQLENPEQAEGVLFFATPDQLSGLTTWTFFDNNAEDSVVTQFGSGCSAVITQTVNENRKGGHRTFIGLFDPSVRPYVGANELSFTIPMSRFREMCKTMRDSCLFDTHAWKKVRERMS